MTRLVALFDERVRPIDERIIPMSRENWPSSISATRTVHSKSKAEGGAEGARRFRSCAEIYKDEYDALTAYSAKSAEKRRG